MTDFKLTYNDVSHRYYLNGKQCKSVSKVAKIPTDTEAIEKYTQRNIAIGLVLDENLLQNVAMNIDNSYALNKVCYKAQEAARSHLKADRGSQRHRVLELILSDRLDRLITSQQKEDALILRRTLDAYKLVPHDGLIEQFVIWPDHIIAGRFDAILEWPDGTTRMVDLKSGANAVKYPHSTATQMALYGRAPYISVGATTDGDKTTIENWRTHPQTFDPQLGYVMLVEDGAQIGELHEIDMTWGWEGATYALGSVNWRKKHDNGKTATRLIPPVCWATEISKTPSLTLLRELWKDLKSSGLLTDDLQQAFTTRSQELTI